MRLIISIIICTRNRAPSLDDTLESLFQCVIPDHLQTELLVIDNGSTDNTYEVVEKHSKHMRVRYIQEMRPGQCYARNCGLSKARGDVILFTDDDVRFPSNWLEGMCSPILDRQADAVQGGIRFAPFLERPWLNGFMSGWIARTKEGEERGLMLNSELIGANMAFSRHVLSKVPYFDVELGPGALGFGDDSLFSLQLVQAGFRLFGAWDVAVEHHFAADRLSERAFIENGRGRGRSFAYIAYHWRHETFRNVWLKLQWLRFKRAVRELISSSGRDPALWRICYAKDISFWEQYLIENRRPRNYTKHGLEKRYGSKFVEESTLTGVTLSFE